MAPHVKITCNKDVPKDVGSTLFGLTLIPYVRLFLMGKVIKLILAEENDLDQYHTPANEKKLLDNGFKLEKSPKYLAKCSVMCKKINKRILDHTEDQLAQAICHFNDVDVQNIKKIPTFKMVKVTCSTPKEASKLEAKGIKIGEQIIPSQDIELEKYVEISQCFRCYGFNHNSGNCKKNQVCSKCGESGHFWRDCKNTTLKCVNCKEAHVAVSLKCKVLRDQTRPKKPETPLPTRQPLLPTPSLPSFSRTANPSSYATVTSLATTTPFPKTPQPTLSLQVPQPTQTDIHTNTKITIITNTAKQLCNGSRKDFLKLVEEGLKANNLPSVVFPPSFYEGPPLVNTKETPEEPKDTEDTTSQNTDPDTSLEPLVIDLQEEPTPTPPSHVTGNHHREDEVQPQVGQTPQQHSAPLSRC